MDVSAISCTYILLRIAACMSSQQAGWSKPVAAKMDEFAMFVDKTRHFLAHALSILCASKSIAANPLGTDRVRLSALQGRFDLQGTLAP